MSPTERLLRLVVATLPPRVRPRYREEWLADLAGARELGLPARDVVLGAVATAVLMDRFDPGHSGRSRAAGVALRLRLGFVLLAAAGPVALGQSLWEGTLQTRGWLGGPGAAVLLGAHTVLVVLTAAVGWVCVLRAVLGARRHWTTPLWGSVALLIHAALAAVLLMLPGYGMLFGAAGGTVAATMVMVHGLVAGRRSTRHRPVRRGLVVALGCSVLIVTVLVVGALDILVWNPLARLPGHTLAEIRAAMTAAGEYPGAAPVVSWCVLWGVVAVGFPPLVARSRALWAQRLRTVVAVGALLVAGAVIGHWFAGFGMGMGMADTFAVSGANASPTGPLVGSIGQLALVAGMLTGLGYGTAPPVSRPVRPQPTDP